MAGLLNDILREWPRSPFVWGSSDCVKAVFDYVQTATDKELPPFCSEYSSASQALRTIKNLGGLETASRDYMRSTGFLEASVPVRGDVGVVIQPGAGATLSIFLGEKWIIKGHYEIFIARLPFLVAWRVPQCQPQQPPQ